MLAYLDESSGALAFSRRLAAVDAGTVVVTGPRGAPRLRPFSWAHAAAAGQADTARPSMHAESQNSVDVTHPSDLKCLDGQADKRQKRTPSVGRGSRMPGI